MKKILIILTLFIIFGCTLEKNNPLDIDFDPGYVSGIKFATSSEASNNSGYKWIDITWDSRPNVDGYLVFRSQYHDGNYILEDRILDVETDDTSQTHTYRDTKHLYTGDYYYYKIACFKYVNEERLEGPKSSYKRVLFVP